MVDVLERLGLESNPFEPAATGAPISGPLLPSKELEQRIRSQFDILTSGQGVRALVVSGEYGLGKTCVLQWLHQEILPKRNIKSFTSTTPEFNSTI